MFLPTAVSICFQQSTQSNPEGDNVATFILNITNPLSTDFTVRVNTMDVTATGKCFMFNFLLLSTHVTGGGVDYNSGPYTVTFTAGQTTALLNIPINDDNIFEDDETFRLTIDPSSLPSRVMLLPLCRLNGTIVDNDCE